jgi:hypothetical protein
VVDDVLGEVARRLVNDLLTLLLGDTVGVALGVLDLRLPANALRGSLQLTTRDRRLTGLGSAAPLALASDEHDPRGFFFSAFGFLRGGTGRSPGPVCT